MRRAVILLAILALAGCHQGDRARGKDDTDNPERDLQQMYAKNLRNITPQQRAKDAQFLAKNGYFESGSDTGGNGQFFECSVKDGCAATMAQGGQPYAWRCTFPFVPAEWVNVMEVAQQMETIADLSALPSARHACHRFPIEANSMGMHIVLPGDPDLSALKGHPQ